eukprot:XP_015134334.1 uncharacterized protein LOC415324 isoform X15 [Gallus gallus]
MSLGQGGLSGSGGAGRDSLGTFLGAGTASDLGSCSLGTAEQQGNIKSVSKMDLLEQAGSGLADPQVSSLLRTLQDKVPTFLQPQYWLRSWMWQVWMELIKAAQVSSSKQAPQEHPQQGLWPSMVRATS